MTRIVLMLAVIVGACGIAYKFTPHHKTDNVFTTLYMHVMPSALVKDPSALHHDDHGVDEAFQHQRQQSGHQAANHHHDQRADQEPGALGQNESEPPAGGREEVADPLHRAVRGFAHARSLRCSMAAGVADRTIVAEITLPRPMVGRHQNRT